MKRRKIWFPGTEDQKRLVDVAFKYYRKKGFPYPQMSPMDLWHDLHKLRDMTCDLAPKQSVFGSIVNLPMPATGLRIANHFHSHIYESHTAAMTSPVASFNMDKRLKRAIRLVLVHEKAVGKTDFDVLVLRMLRLVSGTQVCSNFRPAAAKMIYETYLPPDIRDDAVILDPCTGYGGRLVGFLATALKHPGMKYVGVDPAPKQCAANRKMAEFFGMGHQVELWQNAFEDCIKRKRNREHLGKRDTFDLAFTSPPYFDLEIYDGDAKTQSRTRYPQYPAWRDGFLRPMIESVFDVLKPNRYFLLNIGDIKHKKQGLLPLVADAKDIANDVGFVSEDRLGYVLGGFGANLEKRKAEPVLVLKKD